MLPGYRWHWLAKYFWRVPVAGELFNLMANRPAMRLPGRQSNARRRSMPPDAGHWPWIDRPDLVGRTRDFLTG
jgi:hypothetical protein